MKILNTNKIIILSFEKIGFKIQSVYDENDDYNEISLSIELKKEVAYNISDIEINTMLSYIISESDDKDIIEDFKELIITLQDTTEDLFLVFE